LDPSSTENDAFSLPECSANTDPLGVAVEDAWGEGMTIMNGVNDAHQVTILMRESTTATPAGIRMVAREATHLGVNTFPFTETRVTSDVSTGTNVVPFGYEGDFGLSVGVASYQQCDSGVSNCPGGTSFNYPLLPVFGVWPDARVTTTTHNDTYARTWLF